MSVKRKRRSAEFKHKAVLEVLKCQRTANQIAGELEVHPVALSEWKKEFVEAGLERLAGARKSKNKIESQEKDLFEQIGRLKMEIEYLKKKLWSQS